MSDIDDIARRITSDPDIILEDVASELAACVSHGSLRVKESAMHAVYEQGDDPGDYPNAVAARPLADYKYLDDIYGGAILYFEMPVQTIPPSIHWRLVHEPAHIKRYKEENGRIRSTVGSENTTMLVFTDNQQSVKADADFLQEVLDEKLYMLKRELDLEIELEDISQFSLYVKWVHWEHVEGKLTCTMGVEAEVDHL